MIFNFEKKFLEWIEKNIFYIVFVGIIVLGLLVRYALREVISIDGVHAYLPWFDEIKAGGGFSALSKQVGDYNIFYQFLIAIMTYLPFEPIIGFKLFSIIFDVAMAVLMAKIFVTITGKKWFAAIGFAVIWLNPMVFINSSEWGQCDIIYSFFCLLAVLYFAKEQYLKSIVFLSLGFVFKLQAVFVLPFILLGYVLKKKFSCIYFLLIPVFMEISSIPGLIMGRGLLEPFTLYAGQTSADADAVYINYPSFWALFVKTHNAPFIKTAIFVTVAMLLMIMFYVYKKNIFVKNNMLGIAFMLAYTTVLFLPKMRERYGFMYIMFSIPIALKNKKTLPLCIASHILALMSYGVVELGSPASLKGMAIANMVIYLAYGYLLLKEWNSNTKENA